MRYKSEKYFFIIYILGFLVMALSVALFQPLADVPPFFPNPPDEHARYLVPKYICEHGVIPTGFEEEIRIPSYGFSYALYNAFPYIIQGYVMRFVSLFTDSEVALLYAARGVNVFFGMLMAAVVYLIGRRLFRDRRFRWVFCFAVTYLPENIFVHTYVNTDSCCMLSTAMIFYALVCSYQDGFTRANRLWLSGGIILCALSYYNAYGYILSSILLFLTYFLNKKDGHWTYDWKKMLKQGCFISTVVLLGIGWWFIRSYIVLDGDLLGLKTRRLMAEQYAIELVNPLTMNTFRDMGYSVWEMMSEKNTLKEALYSFIAVFGSMSIYGSQWTYRFYKLLFALGALGCVYYLADRKCREKLGWKKVFFHINMWFCILMPLFLMIYYSYTTDYQHQGRYVLPALVPLMYYSVRGIQKLSGLRIKKFDVPDVLVNIGVGCCILIILIAAVNIIYFNALPMYLEAGLVL